MKQTHIRKLIEILRSLRDNPVSQAHGNLQTFDIWNRLKGRGVDIVATITNASRLISEIQADLERVEISEAARAHYLSTIRQIEEGFSPLTVGGPFDNFRKVYAGDHNLGTLETLEALLQSATSPTAVPLADRQELELLVQELRDQLEASELDADVLDFCKRALDQIQVALASYGLVDREALRTTVQSIMFEASLFKFAEKDIDESSPAWVAFRKLLSKAWNVTQKGRVLIGTHRDYAYLLGYVVQAAT